MRGKADKALLWVIILLVGVALIVMPKLPISLTAVVMVGGGFALVAAWRTKGNIWPLVPGLFLILLGGSRLLRDLFGIDGARWVEGGFFIIPGVIGIISYGAKKRYTLLCVGSVLAWFGVFLTLGHFHLPFIGGGALFCVCIAAAMFMACLIAHRKGVVYACGWVWAAFAAIAIGARALRFVLAAALIAVAVYSLVKSRADRNHGANNHGE